MMRPNSEGLEALEEVIRLNAHQMNSELLEQLTSAYEMANSEVEGIDSYIDDMESIEEKAYDLVTSYEDEIESLSQRVDELFNKSDDATTVEDFFLQVSSMIEGIEIEEFNHVFGKKDSDVIEKAEKAAMDKMMQAGYKFNCKSSEEIQREHDEKALEEKRIEEEKMIEKQRREAAWQKVEDDRKKYAKWIELNGKDLPIKVNGIEKTDTGIYEIRSYDVPVSAKYNTNTEKVSGKGSRIYKNEIIECVNNYIEFMKNYVGSSQLRSLDVSSDYLPF